MAGGQGVIDNYFILSNNIRLDIQAATESLLISLLEKNVLWHLEKELEPPSIERIQDEF